MGRHRPKTLPKSAAEGRGDGRTARQKDRRRTRPECNQAALTNHSEELLVAKNDPSLATTPVSVNTSPLRPHSDRFQSSFTGKERHAGQRRDDRRRRDGNAAR